MVNEEEVKSIGREHVLTLNNEDNNVCVVHLCT